jgi:2,4-dienoyl-CoA reductase-like NADH-dependent reductase (Old Yellow Enzyme family)
MLAFGRGQTMNDTTLLSQPFTLPNGSVIKNRLVKAAMSETLATISNRPTEGLVKLYERWARGGIGLCVSGNVMIDRNALGEPNNVVVEDETDLESLKQWANAGTREQTQLWMQINHPGKQAPRGLNRETVAPSAIPFSAGLSRFFSLPRALTEPEIEAIVVRFGNTVRIAKKAGFTGAQIHGAHGYLVSQFLSPHHNQRSDKWGGSQKNRMRFALEVFAEMRRQVGAHFPIGIKLNSADFQRGGFSEQESIEVIGELALARVDLVEISGGTYEAPAMTGAGQVKESTRKREAYFLEFAEKARTQVKVPLLLTGGFRSLAGMRQALSSNAVDFIGLARPLAVEPELPHRLLKGLDATQELKPIATGIKALDRLGMMEIPWYTRQLKRMGSGDDPKPNDKALQAFVANIVGGGWRMLKTRARSCKDS